MELSSSKILGEPLSVFHHYFHFGVLLMFSFFTTYFYQFFSGDFIADCIFSFHQFYLPWLLFRRFFARYFIFMLFYRECYGFEGAFFYSQVFFILHSFPKLATVPRVLRIWVNFFLLSGVFYLTLLLNIWHNLLVSRLPWELAVFLESCRASHWG